MTRPSIDEHFRVHDPSLHDYEVRTIEFDNPDVVIKLVSPGQDQTVVLKLKGCSYLCLDTDHVQNVVFNAYIFPPDRRTEAQEREEYRVARSWIDGEIGDDEVITYLEPAAGIEAVCVSRSVHLFQTSVKASR